MLLLNLWSEFRQDVRYALRVMAGHPLFTATAALSLALGIGANTAIYSFMDAILMRALPVQNPETLALLNWHSKAHPAVAHHFSGSTFTDAKFGRISGNFPYQVYEMFRDRNQVFSSIFAFNDARRLNIQIHGQAEIADGEYVSGGFFSGLGVRPVAGRTIIDADDAPGASPIAVVSYGYARRRFGEAAKAIGQSMLINDHPFTIVGVAAPEFFGIKPGNAQDVYLPLHANNLLELVFTNESRTKWTQRDFYWVEMMVRLRPGVSRQQAEAVLAPQFRQFVESTATNARERADLPTLIVKEGAGGLENLRRQYSKPLYVLMTLVALILAIACANIANLLLARGAARRREMAVRLSLGAGRMRVVRQLLTESVLLAVLGGLAGLACAKWGIGALTALIANGRDNFTLHADLNWRVLAMTFALSVGTGFLFGLAPALQSARVDFISALKQARGGEPRFRLHGLLRVSLRQVLMVSQIAISLLMLAGAGLFVRTLTNLNSIQIGFNRENLLLVTLSARQAGYKDDALLRFYGDLQTRFSGIPGVRSVSVSHYAMVSGSRSSSDFKMQGYSGPAPESDYLYVGANFLSTMQIPVLLGREIEQRDAANAPKVAVVNETFVKKYLEGGNPLGRHLSMRWRGTAADFEIVGVAKDSRLSSLKDDIRPLIYGAYAQNPAAALGAMVFALRAAGDPLALAASARRVVQQADARVPVWNIVTQAEQIDRTIGQERTFAMLCTCFAVLAVLIACVGLYGSMAHSVARRTNEIGIRMALGAERRRLMWMVLREVLLMAIAGLALGLPAAVASAHFVQSFLFRMKANDPVAMTLAAVTLLAAAITAGYGPAWRASRVDPWTALRDE
jgi:predicted permease